MNSSKILIDTGPSRRGFHRLEAHMRCARLYALGYGRAGSGGETAEMSRRRFPPASPLVRGSIGHVGMAHLYARLRAVQRREDPDAYYVPTEAMGIVADSFGELGQEMLPIASRTVRAYAKHYARENIEVLGVEDEEEVNFYDKFLYTARVDLEYRDRSGKVWFADHKLVNKIEGKVLSRYVLSGQFLGLAHLGARKWGDAFAGVAVNLLGVNPISFVRVAPDPAPWMLERFPEMVALTEESIARTEQLISVGRNTPASPSEFLCYTPYGRCPAFEMCRWGESHDIGTPM